MVERKSGLSGGMGSGMWEARWPWDDGIEDQFRRLRQEMDRIFTGPRIGLREFPAINVWLGSDGAVVTAEIPGIDPKDVEIVAQGSTLSLRGERITDPAGEASHLHRERDTGRFVRDVDLPFEIDADRVEATYERGILSIKAPRSETDRPHKIEIKSP